MSSIVQVALAGNPNAGKTTLFNALTGARQHVGNYPGVTVQRKEGVRRHGGHELRVRDLPGTYSLTAYSTEERIARDELLHQRPDVVVDVVDASNLERNLYLTTQLLELGLPLVIALNMSDVAEARGLSIDAAKLSALLGVPIVRTVGSKGRGVEELLAAVEQVAADPSRCRPPELHYGADIEAELARLVPLVAAHRARFNAGPASDRWIALKLLEGDGVLAADDLPGNLGEALERATAHLATLYHDKPEVLVADRRYGFISGACQQASVRTVETRHTVSDQVDAVFTSRIFGLPIFLGLMYLVFQFVFRLGNPAMGGLESLFGWLARLLHAHWPGAPDSALLSLLSDGIIGGVGGVIVFLPNILLLFLAIAALEDTGYMARAAYVMDGAMTRIGLHGKSFIPMLLGFGCSVPAIMATRTLEHRRDRLATMLVIPLISCGARLTVYALIIPAFFPERLQAPMLMAIYLIGIGLAIGLAKMLRVTVLRGEGAPLVMELPPYRLPTLKGMVIHMWEQSWHYLRKAGTVILGISIVMWALTSYPRKQVFERDYAVLVRQAEQQAAERTATLAAPLGGAADKAVARLRGEADRIAALREDFERAVGAGRLKPSSSAYRISLHDRDTGLWKLQAAAPALYAAAARYIDDVRKPLAAERAQLEADREAERLAWTVAGRVGHAIEPAIRPLGFDWRIGTALLGAFAAKEVFVAQMGIVFAVGDSGTAHDEALRVKLRHTYSRLTGFCVLLFTLLSMPCMATVAVTRQESGSWRWTALQAVGLSVLAYVLTLLVYQGGCLLGMG